MHYPERFDVIVVGGGHAGTEAALAAARGGARTLLLTQSIETLGQMSCNPAIGGIGKGHLVREIDALGGAMGAAADRCGIHVRTLNASKGPAVRATRAQIDRALYRNEIRKRVERQPRLWLFQQSVDDLLLASDSSPAVAGVRTQAGLELFASKVVLTVGTFLGGRIHVGTANHRGGRAGDPPADALAERLRALPFRVGRLKTGTPPRLDGRTVDWERLEVQLGDDPAPSFSFARAPRRRPPQVPCHITCTTPETHAIIRTGLDRSPMFTGAIDGVGPRYCPSVEDKVVRFADKSSHQIFVEPEGLETSEVYPNGISTSLPFDVQHELVRSIPGFARAHITRPGYAIEYDFLDPRDLRSSLESAFVAGLYLAGQINGTTGYEEAAAQGLVAGINAARAAAGREPWCPRRDEAYIGVLVDDLVTRGAPEPYRMFTSRAEFRLSLREDNADLRLTETGRRLGVVEDAQWAAFSDKRERLEREQARLESTWVHPERVPAAALTEALGNVPAREHSAAQLLRRPEVTYEALMALPGVGPGIGDADVAAQLEIRAKYSGYIERQAEEIARLQAQESVTLPHDLDFERVRGLSAEVREQLTRHRPATLGQAARLPGVTPAAVAVLSVHLRRQGGSPAGEKGQDRERVARPRSA